MGFNNSIITLEEMVRRRFRSEEIVSISASSGGGVGGPSQPARTVQSGFQAGFRVGKTRTGEDGQN